MATVITNTISAHKQRLKFLGCAFTRLCMKVMLIGLNTLIFVLAEGAEPEDLDKNYIGMNTWFLTDWDGSNAFVDIMKHARAWHDSNWQSENQTRDVDADGWPNHDCSTVIFGLGVEAGTYHLVFNGQADVQLMWYTGSVSNYHYDAGTNTSTAEVLVTTDTGFSGGLVFTNTRKTSGSATNTGIANVRLFRPGYPADGSVVFTDRFLNVARKFQLIRFMWWQNAWNSPVETWSQRRTPSQANLGVLDIGGNVGERDLVAMEHLVQLCNETDADMWLCLPVNADDDYVRRTAQLIRYGSDGVNPYTFSQSDPVFPPLESGLKVYIELANETWLGLGAAQSFLKRRTDAIRGAPFEHPIEFDGETGEWTLLARYKDWRSVEISKIFREVWGDDAMLTRVRPLIMGQFGGGWREFSFLEAFYSTWRPASDPFPNTQPQLIRDHIYGAGCAPYYGVIDWSSPDPDTFYATSNWPQPSYTDYLLRDAMMSRNFGLRLIGYEGGFSMGGDGGANTFTVEEKLRLNADPRMKEVVKVHHDLWSAYGGDMIAYYCMIEGSGGWGFTWDVDIPETPKNDAIEELLTEDRSPVTMGPTIPGEVIAREAPTILEYGCYPFHGEIDGEAVIGGIKPDYSSNYWVALPFHTEQEGYYDLTVRMASDQTGPVEVAIALNGQAMGILQTMNPGVRVLYTSDPIRVPVHKGLSVVRFSPQTTSTAVHNFLRSITFTYAGPFEVNLPRTIDHRSVDVFDGLPQATRDAVAQQRWLFTHASVGANMLDGMRDLHSHDATHYPLQVTPVSYDAAAQRAASYAAPGSNGMVYACDRSNPGWEAKLSIFANTVNSGGWHQPNVGLVMNKLCYIDESADAQTYLDSMAALEASHPGTTFVYTSMPLTTSTDSASVLRNVYNATVRTYCSTHGKLLFDIADIQAHEPDGTPVTFSYNGQSYQRLADIYTSDGGHLNATGRQRLARSWYSLAAAALSSNDGISQWRAQFYSANEITEGLGNPGADDDGDGLPTVFEYIFDRNPRQPDRADELACTVTDGHTAFSFERAANVRGVEVTAETWTAPNGFTRLATFSNGIWTPRLAGVVVKETGTNPVEVTVTLPGNPTMTFVRLRAAILQ